MAIPRGELEYRATRAGGAGGQHVNTSSTRIELLWNVPDDAALDDEHARAGRGASWRRASTARGGSGWSRARGAASSRTGRRRRRGWPSWLRGALVVQKRRKPTKPTRGAKEARLGGEGEARRDEAACERLEDIDLQLVTGATRGQDETARCSAAAMQRTAHRGVDGASRA